MTRKYLKINDLIEEISMGPFGSDIKVEFYVAKGVPVLNGSNISGVKLTESFKNYVTEERAGGYRKAVAKRGDIVITHRGTLGQVSYIPYDSMFERYVISQSQFKVRLNQNLVNPIYFTYFFHSQEGQKRLLSFKSHVGVPALAQATTNFRLLDFPIRSKAEQDEIANVLSTIDKKIELNNRINTELEAMAKTLYDYWFVQFDFPNEQDKPYKSSGGKMVFNEILKREIPEGWESDYVENLLVKESRTEKLPKTMYQTQGSIPVIDQSTDYICGYTNNANTLIKTEKPRIIFGDHTRILKLINFNFARGADGTQVLLSNNENVPQHLFYHSLLKIDLSNYGYARHFKYLKQTQTIIPDYEIAIQFEKKCKSFYDQIRHNIFETKKLEELRDWLLPMLMNGQVTVK